MVVRRRLLPPLAALCALALGLASCSENPITAPGVDSEILVKNGGPVGVAPPDQFGPYAWAVNTIDSVLFTDDIDSTRLDVTSFRMSDPQPFPSPAYAFNVKDPPARSTLGKMYFVPDAPLHGHTEYTCRLSTGIRMSKGTLVRDVFQFQFTTGDSVAPPSPAR